MLYRIGEVAEILGVTKEGVRFLERKGLLESFRNEENGYRYYERRDLGGLQMIRGYAAVGFTLEEAAELVRQSDETHILEALDARRVAVDEEIAALEARRALLDRQRERVAWAASIQEEWSVCQAEGMYYLPVDGRYAPPADKELYRIEKAWLAAAPTVLHAKMPLDREGKLQSSYGLCISEPESRHLQLPLQGAVLLPAGQCLVAHICTPVGGNESYRELYRWVIERGWRPVGDMFVQVRLSTLRDGIRCNLNTVRMPVEKERP